MSKLQPTYEDRIEDIHAKLNRRVNLVHLTEICMDMKVSEFNELEDSVEIAVDTDNAQGITEIVNKLHGMS